VTPEICNRLQAEIHFFIMEKIGEEFENDTLLIVHTARQIQTIISRLHNPGEVQICKRGTSSQ